MATVRAARRSRELVPPVRGKAGKLAGLRGCQGVPVRQGGHLRGDSGEVTVAFPGPARTTGGPPAAMPRRRAGLSRFREPDAGLSRTVRFSSTAPATERGASVSVTSSTFTPADAMNLATRTMAHPLGIPRAEPGRFLPQGPPASPVLPAPAAVTSGPRPCKRAVL
jgi:hypothetical protein